MSQQESGQTRPTTPPTEAPTTRAANPASGGGGRLHDHPQEAV
jgi:hypothetical protein